MGIVFSFLEFFDLCYRQKALSAPMIALGSLEINEPESAIAAFAAQNTYWQCNRDQGVRSLFRDRYGVMDYRDSDLNDRADLKIDLNQPLAPELVGSAMTIVNGGTVEHIFNIAQAMINMHDMARPGATIIHLAPVSWYEHGYYNFNPRLFTAVAQTNAYALVAEAFWFPSDVLPAVVSLPPRRLHRAGLLPGGSPGYEAKLQTQCQHGPKRAVSPSQPWPSRLMDSSTHRSRQSLPGY